VLGLIGKTLSHYTLLEQIGQGGMSSVFSAVDQRDQRAVAVKILSPYIAHEARFKARFEREIKLLSRLQHPNIMPILDFGEADGLAYIIMPYIGTGTLGDRLLKGPVEAKDGARIVEQLASALAAAHAAGVVHRDVKPSNVLLDPMGNALLSDFSFAHQTDASQNLTGSALIGTPAYMSPEQCRGEPIDARSDQYALAVVLYQMTTGKLPFEADTPMGTALKHVNEPLPRPRLVNPSIPEEVELVLVRGLAKDPALRYASILELNDAFQEALRLALDPTRRVKTRDVDRTTAIYNKYQNVKPPPRRRWFERSALVVALLLLVVCPASAAVAALFYSELLYGAPAEAAPPTPDIQATVDVIVAANVARSGMSAEALKTAVYVAVMGTLAANGTPIDDPTLAAVVFGSAGQGTPTPFDLGLVFPTSPPTTTRTLGPGESPLPPTASPSPTRTPTPGPSPTSGSTLAVSLTDVASSPTPTVAASASLPAPTATSAFTATATRTFTPVPPTAAPSNTPSLPTATSPPPPTATKTPRPINPNACNADPDHLNHCTPTPGA
jgi:serine/threonine-protein kinase